MSSSKQQERPVATNGCHRLNRPLLCFSEGGRQELLDNGVATRSNLPATPIVERGEDEDDTTGNT